ncbi:MAG: preprotein translocase subunit SecG [Candidatus Omnitrophota bacterium]
MYIFLIVVHVIVALFLVFVILLQKGRGEGMADVFGGGSSQTTIFGTRAGTFLTRATTTAAILFMVTCLLLTIFSSKRGLSVVDKQFIKEQIEKQMPSPEKETDKQTVEKKVEPLSEQAVEVAPKPPVEQVTKPQPKETQSDEIVVLDALPEGEEQEVAK